MINTIRWDLLMIYGWMDKDLMEAWSFIFPLMDKSKKDECLPLIDSAWHSPSVEANPNYHNNNELHAQDIDQANAAESVGACHHPDAGNPSAQRGSTPGRMELDEFQEGFCPRIFHSPGIIVVTETCISDSKASDILHSLPYDGIHTTDPNGYARAKVAEFHFLVRGSSSHPKKTQRFVTWSKPNLGWYKLNTDASVLPSSGRAGGCGLLKDSNGSWVRGFSRLIGSSSILLAELWPLRYGIAMAKSLNIDKLIINVDASEVINLFSKPSYTNRLTQPIVNDCRNMLQAFQEYRMQHYFRETNRAACLQILAAAKLNLLFLM
nr:putative ribonuclease h protein [Quercus suber]